MRPKNNPQPKPLYRKPGHKARRKAVRDSKRIYHAKTMKTKLAQEYRNLPGLREALQSLREQIADEEKPPAQTAGEAVVEHTEEQQQVAEALDANAPATGAIFWPRSIDHSLELTVAEGVRIKGYWPSDVCQCLVDCFSDGCSNATSSLFCDEDNCKFEGRCSNGILECSAMELFQSAIGIGVRATDTIPVGATFAPYTGFLTDFDYDAEVHQRHYVISLHARS
ncbi:hypothetical protein PHYSODRAFT_299485 [Phytophthora sojae]|uniref:AWS domain-containing protein n=1 Tax=Phytophthora sojae (strain P6497) TaxID=1094619 RepID=G4Z9D5_PHYSP|nr:hypothetical protein PHYSODRAFT_299485 [Phytophthora sojae]EGZ21936.1 hypothetical protein PHYSODRAFT_299485 [Phytophthora sojae]|eukprot:XP_009524653.1 hypothetical protein PHYSODRAFT_299485 [Phytophthora sojae]